MNGGLKILKKVPYMNTFWHDHLLSFSIRYMMNIIKTTDWSKVLRYTFSTLLNATMLETFDFSFKNITIDIQIDITV